MLKSDVSFGIYAHLPLRQSGHRENDSNNVADLGRFPEVVTFVYQGFCYCRQVCQQKFFAVEHSRDFDKAIIWYVIHELQEKISNWSSERYCWMSE
jgi:hypothetical protein